MARGFLYLVAIIDWASRAVLAWRLSNSMDVSFCLEALDEALARYGKPEIFNTDQGSQFTSAAFTGRLEAAKIRISMDGRGRWLDNVFVERLWRSLKYEEVHLKAVRRRPRGQGRHLRLGDLLQHAQTPSGAGQPSADGGVAGRRHWPPAGQRCGHDAALGRR